LEGEDFGETSTSSVESLTAEPSAMQTRLAGRLYHFTGLGTGFEFETIVCCPRRYASYL